MIRPRLADVKCQHIRFRPGDRVLVRTTHQLDADEERRLKRSIIKWAGCEVRVYIYCVLDMQIELEQGK